MLRCPYLENHVNICLITDGKIQVVPRKSKSAIFCKVTGRRCVKTPIRCCTFVNKWKGYVLKNPQMHPEAQVIFFIRNWNSNANVDRF